MTRAWQIALLGAVSAVALGGFSWPLVSAADSAQVLAPVAAMTLLPVLLLIASLALDRSIANGTTVAMLGVLAAVATVLRVASTGFGGFELVFTVVILAASVFGVRFGFLLGLTTMLVSSLIWGGIGPWTAFQAFALAWVGAGAGIVGRLCGVDTRSSVRCRVRGHVAALATYGAIASYAFGMLMNLWFWPIAVGAGTDISYLAGAPLDENLRRFFGYTLVTSTLTWDTVRAATTVAGITLTGGIVLSALNRSARPKNTSLRGGEKRTRRLTVLDEVEVLPTARRPRVQA